MKTLILMRHAKSDWGAGRKDIERPLNPRGEKSAQAMGEWMRQQGIRPDVVLCSSAARTQQTLDGLALTSDVPVTLLRDLYLAEPAQMLEILQQAQGERVLVLGHNPGSAMLAATLLSALPEHPEFSNFPTCATLVAHFDIHHWHDLAPGTGVFLHFIVPRDLIDKKRG